MPGTLRLAVFVSGGGTNLQAIIDACEAGRIRAKVAVVVSNNPQAYGLVRASAHGISQVVVEYGNYGRKRMREVPFHLISGELEGVLQTQRICPSEEEDAKERLARLILAEREIIRKLEPFQPDLICLAGYMRLLTPYFIHHFNREGVYRIMNIHPALLPSFPGGHGYEDTFRYGCRFGGITTHFVDEGEDTGPIIAQAVYPIYPEDTVETIRQRGLQMEYRIYPQSIQWYARGELEVVEREGRKVVRIHAPDAREFFMNLEREVFQV